MKIHPARHILATASRFVALCLMLLTATSFPRQLAAQTDAEQVIRIGRNVLSMEDYMLAIQYFNLAIKAKPYLADPYFFRALAKLNLEDYKGAEEDCTLALDRNKFRAEAYKLRGFARQNMGMDSLAITDYDIGLSYYPLDKYFLYYKAVAQTGINHLEGADSTFSALLRAYPNFEEGYSARGRLNLLRGDTVAALADIDKSLDIDRNLVNSYLMRSEIKSKLKQWPEALTDMDEAIKLRPQEADLYVNRAYLRYNNDDYFGAMSDYNYALELTPENTAALFNRGLLRYEVNDLNRAEADFSKVLKQEPNNFHALYNRGLVNLDRKKFREAYRDFQAISKRYSKFYPAFYAMAEALQGMGETRAAIQNAYHAEGLIRQYVKNPERNPLDRPAIAAGTANDRGTDRNEDESEIDVMNRFNHLVTVSSSGESKMAYNEKIKGQVQNRDVRVEQEPPYYFSFSDTKNALRSISNYFRELDDLNQHHYIPYKVFLSNAPFAQTDETQVKHLFEITENLNSAIERGSTRPVDYLARGLARSLLKNYEGSIEDFDKAIEMNPDFTVAYMARGFARLALAHSPKSENETSAKDAPLLPGMETAAQRNAAIADFDRAIELNPRLIFAWFNKGNIYYETEDFTSAIQSYSEAIAINPDFGQAYFNRGLSYLRIGDKTRAFTDLSKAGELGILPSYNLLKRMK